VHLLVLSPQALLNDVNNLFDALLEKHGLTKIRRSGETCASPHTGQDSPAWAVRPACCTRRAPDDTSPPPLRYGRPRPPPS
jgi:hypothetical protein